MRGIVISPPIDISDDGAFSLAADIDEQQLRGWLLFWDKLDLPKVRAGLNVETDVEQYLKNAGILESTMLWIEEPPKINGDLLAWPMLKAYEMKNRTQRGLWSLAMGPGALNITDSLYAKGQGIQVKLLRAVPVPDKEVPYEDVLEFKSKRRDQLAALWATVDDIAADFQDDPKRPLAEAAAVRRFAREAAFAVEVFNEAGLSYRMASLTAKYTTVGLVAAASSIAFGASLPEIVGNGLLAAGGAAVSDTMGLHGLPDKTPFAYVVGYHSELFSRES